MYEEKDEVVQLYLDDIIPNRFQPREVFDETALKELAVSIKEHGVIQPIIVRNVNGKYEIIAGERRYKASALAGLTKIPAIIRNLDDKESSKVALLENLQRKNLNPIEEARTYQKILELDEMTQEELAKTMGKSQSAVANKIRLLSLPEDIQEALLKEKISERHARALLNVTDQQVQKSLVEKIISTKMSVRALEEEIKNMYPKEELVEENVTATKEEFLNTTPLAPTQGLVQEETSNYGKVVISPPKEDNTTELGPVNYGEIGKDDNPNIGMGGEPVPTEENRLTIEGIKANAADINSTSTGVALDDMLNIQAPSTRAPEAINKPTDEYFSYPEAVSSPEQTGEDGSTVVPNIMAGADTIPLVNIQPTQQVDIEKAVNQIKNTIEALQTAGYKIKLDETSFPYSYQIIINIDKE